MNHDCKSLARSRARHAGGAPILRMPLAFALAALSASATLAAETPPSAGSLLQQMQPPRPPAAASADVGVKVEGADRTPGPDSIPFRVSRVVISGNSIFDTDTLHALVASAEGRELTLAQLDAIVAHIGAFYRERGYPLTRAVVPAQSVRDGVVQVRVIEARYGAVRLDNHSRARDALLAGTLSGLPVGTDVRQSDYERALLMLSDVPGVQVSAVLKPGTEVGTTDLQVEAMPTKPVIASVGLDNYGNRATGRARLTGTVTINEPFRLGDVASMGITSTGSGMNAGTLTYDALLSPAGTHLGASVAALHYALGDGFASLHGHGDAGVVSAWLRQSLVRRREMNLSMRMQWDHQDLHDDLDASAIHSDRRIDSGTLAFDGNAADQALDGGVDMWVLAMTTGKPVFDNPQAQLADAATSRTQSGFVKLTLNAAHTQALGAHDALFINLYGQWSNRNLDPSQKMEAGGPFSVRAYDVGTLSGDEGVLGTIELRHQVGPLLGGALQAVAFYDAERVVIDKRSWSAGDDSATLQGAGAGLGWSAANGWSARVYTAISTGVTPAVTGLHRHSWSGWADVAYAF